MAGNSEGEIQTNFREKTIENNRVPLRQGCDEKAVATFGLIKDILEKCTQKCCGPARFENFLSCLPEVREKNPGMFDNILLQLIKHLQVNLKQELELMFQEENLVSLCQQMDEITNSTTDTGPAWRPSGIPSKDIQEHIVSVKLEFRDKLEEKLKLLQDENEVLKNTLMLTKKDIEKTEKNIIDKHNQLKTIPTACDMLTTSNNNEDNKYSLKNIIQKLEKNGGNRNVP